MTKDEHWLLREKYQGQESAAFLADCMRLSAGEPLAYIIGSIPFLDCTIHLDSKPLIPRPETEYWTKRCITEMSPAENPRSVLDLCAGSGCIGVAILKSLPQVTVDFVEIEPLHSNTIKKNLHENEINDTRYHIYTSDLFVDIPMKKYHHILTNPPYIDPVLDRAETSVTTFEPHTALYGGMDGMELIEKIITQAPQYLHQQGQLWIEHEPEQSAAIQTLGKSSGFATTTHSDQYNVERYSVLVLQ